MHGALVVAQLRRDRERPRSSGSGRAAGRRRGCRVRGAVLRSPSALPPSRLPKTVSRSSAVRISRRARRAYSPAGSSSMTRSHSLDRFAVAFLAGEEHAVVERRARVSGSNAQHALGTPIAASRGRSSSSSVSPSAICASKLYESRCSRSTSSAHRVLLRARPSRRSVREFERRLGVRRHGVERRDQFGLGARRRRLALHEQPREIESHRGEIGVERRARSRYARDRAVDVAQPRA